MLGKSRAFLSKFSPLRLRITQIITLNSTRSNYYKPQFAATSIIALSLLGFYTTQTLAEEDKNGDSTTKNASFKSRVIGDYENRIRRTSSPEKVFEYFASIQLNDQAYMTVEDFIRCITPFNKLMKSAEVGSKNFKYNWQAKNIGCTSEQLSEYKELIRIAADDEQITNVELDQIKNLAEKYQVSPQQHYVVLKELGLSIRDYNQWTKRVGRKVSTSERFLELVDVDGDGLISFSEYLFFTTLLSISSHEVDIAFKMIDENGDGTVDSNEFNKILSVFMNQTAVGRAVSKNQLQTSSTSAEMKHVGLMKRFFGENGNDTLTMTDFDTFLRQLRTEVFNLEYVSYADEDNMMSAQSFAMFLLSHSNHSSDFEDKLNVVSEFKGKVTKEELSKFMIFMDHSDEMSSAIEILSSGDKSRGLSPMSFMKAAKAAAPSTVITPLQLQVIYTLYDLDGDGKINMNEFLLMMKQLSAMGTSDRRDLGVIDFFISVQKCSRILSGSS